MTRTLLLVFAAFAVVLAISMGTATSAGEKDSTDITNEVRELNSAKYAAPPVEFRRGNTTARAVDAKSVEKTTTGFTIKLPNESVGSRLPAGDLVAGA